MTRPTQDPLARLRVALEELERRLVDFGAPIVEHLRPGLPAEQVRAALGSLGITPTAEMEVLWGWHDGTDAVARSPAPQAGFGSLEGNQLLAGWYLMTLPEAIEQWTMWRGIDAAAEWEEDVFPPQLFPVLHFLGSPMLCQDTEAGDGITAPVYVFDVEFAPPDVYAPSLAHVIERFVELFDTGCVVEERLGPGPTIDPDRLPPHLQSDPYL